MTKQLQIESRGFTAKQLKVSTVSIISLTTKFEGGSPRSGDSTYVGLTCDFVELLLHVTYLYMTSHYFPTARANHSCRCKKHAKYSDPL